MINFLRPDKKKDIENRFLCAELISQNYFLNLYQLT